MCTGSVVSNLKWIQYLGGNLTLQQQWQLYIKWEHSLKWRVLLCLFWQQQIRNCPNSLFRFLKPMKKKSHHLRKVHRRTCRWRCGNSGCIHARGPRVAAGGERAPGLGCDSAWPPTRPSGGSPGSWTSRGPTSDPMLHQVKALRDKRGVRGDVSYKVDECSTEDGRENGE